MSVRVAFLSLVLLAVPVLSQQPTMNQRVPGGNWSPTIVRPEPPGDLNSPTFRLQAINQDAEELSALSASLQSDLHQLRKGIAYQRPDAEPEENGKTREEAAPGSEPVDRRRRCRALY